MFAEVIRSRRAKYPECSYLSDWQVHSAHLTTGAINQLTFDWQVGPLFVPMPTGSGKTTGAIWGISELIEEYPDLRICFLTPYKESVEQIFTALGRYVSGDKLGYYFRDCPNNKWEALEKQVVVLTHSFLGHNTGVLDDRDIFVVDEALYATGEASLRASHIGQARSWAKQNGIMSSEFDALFDYVNDLDKAIRQSEQKYLAAPKPLDTGWAKSVAHDLDLRTYSQTLEQPDLLNGVVRFCQALLEGMVFVSKGSTQKGIYDPIFSAAVFGIPKIEKTVVLSATGGLLYSIAGPFQQDSGSRDYWEPPIYDNLKLVQLSGPNLPSQYAHWNNDTSKGQIVGYLDWLLSTIPETKIYMSMPKKVIELLREYFGQSVRGEVIYPYVTGKHDKTIYVSHHAISTGSNQFKDCDGVIYLWENHLPASVAIQRFHILSDEPVTDAALADANSYRLAGNYQRIRDAQYLDNTMQHLGRGNMRNIATDRKVGTMSAYVLFRNSDLFTRLSSQYQGCALGKLEYDNVEVEGPKGRIERVIDYLIRHDNGEDVPASIVEQNLGFALRQYSQALEDSFELACIGYQFKKGGRGRGKGAIFERSK